MRTSTEGITDYYPFGMVARSYSSSEQYRYGFNTQEKVEELGEGHMTAMFWEYDSRLGRRWNIDPKPNVAVSSYATLTNNPIWNVDIMGDTSYQFRPNGTFYRKYDDGSKLVTGQWFKTETKNYDQGGTHVSTTYSNPVNFSFNDINLDREALMSLEEGGIATFGVGDIDNMVNQTKTRSMVDKSYSERVTFIKTQSVDAGPLDYSGKVGSPLKSFNIIDGVLYNMKDAGNFVWAYSASILKFSYLEVKMGSEYYAWSSGKSSNAFEDKTEYSEYGVIKWFQEKTWTGDSEADQKAILRGYYLKNKDCIGTIR